MNPVIWCVGAPWFGWRMGGLGGWLYLWVSLPANGLAIGVASVPLLTATLGRRHQRTRLVWTGLVIQALTLVAWLGIASQLHMFVGDLTD